MTNNDEMALKLKAATEQYTDEQWFHYLRLARHSNILALLAERDRQARRIEMLEKYVNERDEENQDLLLTVGRLHTKLEARTVSVKLLAEPFYPDGDIDCPLVVELDDVKAACVAAGIILVVGGEQ